MKSRNKGDYGNFNKLTIIKGTKYYLTLNIADQMHFKEGEHGILKITLNHHGWPTTLP